MTFRDGAAGDDGGNAAIVAAAAAPVTTGAHEETKRSAVITEGQACEGEERKRREVGRCAGQLLSRPDFVQLSFVMKKVSVRGDSGGVRVAGGGLRRGARRVQVRPESAVWSLMCASVWGISLWIVGGRWPHSRARARR